MLQLATPIGTAAEARERPLRSLSVPAVVLPCHFNATNREVSEVEYLFGVA